LANFPEKLLPSQTPSVIKYSLHIIINHKQGCQQQIAKSEENTPGAEPWWGPRGQSPRKLLDSDDLVCPKINFLDSKFDFLGCL